VQTVARTCVAASSGAVDAVRFFVLTGVAASSPASVVARSTGALRPGGTIDAETCPSLWTPGATDGHTTDGDHRDLIVGAVPARPSAGSALPVGPPRECGSGPLILATRPLRSQLDQGTMSGG
jgi:hypothetical protein